MLKQSVKISLMMAETAGEGATLVQDARVVAGTGC